MTEMMNNALSLAKKGFKVFPLCPNSKIPLKDSNGYLDATNDLNKIAEWWNEDPNRNIGIATGNGLFVLDIDSPSHNPNINGFDSLSKWEKEYGKLPDTFTVETPSGGRHLYFCLNSNLTCKANLLPGIDYRNEKGYIVAPGSIINAKRYKVINDVPISKDANNLLNYLERSKPIRHEINNSSSKLIEVGNRQDYLLHEISKIYDSSLSKNTLKEILKAINNNQLKEPLSLKELENTLFKMIDKDSFKPNSNLKRNEEIKDINLELASEITPKEVEWLVPGYIPKNAITLLVGDGDTGKSSLASNIASALSLGNPSILSEKDDIDVFPKGKTMILTSEEAVNISTVPRLKRYGADLSQIILTDKPSIISDIYIGSLALEKLIAKYSPTLVILDPLQQFLKDVNMWSRNEVRQSMTSLNALCEKYDVTFLIIMHTNKRENIESARNKVSDSADIYDFARSVLMVGKISKEERFVSLEKKNLNGPSDPDETILWKFSDTKLIKTGTTDKGFNELYVSEKSMSREQKKIMTKDNALKIVEERQPIAMKKLRDLIAINSSAHMAKIMTKELIDNKELILIEKAIQKGGIKRYVTLPSYNKNIA